MDKVILHRYWRRIPLSFSQYFWMREGRVKVSSCQEEIHSVYCWIRSYSARWFSLAEMFS